MVRTRSAFTVPAERGPELPRLGTSGEDPQSRLSGKPQNRLWPFSRSTNDTMEPITSVGESSHFPADVPASGNLPIDSESGVQPSGNSSRPHDNRHIQDNTEQSRLRRANGTEMTGGGAGAAHEATRQSTLSDAKFSGRRQAHLQAEGTGGASAPVSADGTMPFWTPRHSSASGGNGVPAFKGGTFSPELNAYSDAVSGPTRPSTAASEDVVESDGRDSSYDSDSERFLEASDERPSTAPASPHGFSTAAQEQKQEQQYSKPGTRERSSSFEPQAQRELRPSTAPSLADSDCQSEEVRNAGLSRAQALQRLKQRTAARRSMLPSALPPPDILLQHTGAGILDPGLLAGNHMSRESQHADFNTTPGQQLAANSVSVSATQSPKKVQLPLKAQTRTASQQGKRIARPVMKHKSPEELLTALFEGARVRRLLHLTLHGLCRKILDLQVFLDSLHMQQMEESPASTALLRQVMGSCEEARTRFAGILRGEVVASVADRSQHLHYEYTGEDEQPQPAVKTRQSKEPLLPLLQLKPQRQQEQHAADSARAFAPSLPPTSSLQEAASSTGPDTALPHVPTLEHDRPTSPVIQSYSRDSGMAPLPTSSHPGSPSRPSASDIPTITGVSSAESDHDAFMCSEAPIEGRPAGMIAATEAVVANGGGLHARRAANLRRHSTIGFATLPTAAPQPSGHQPSRATDEDPGSEACDAETSENEATEEASEGKSFLKRRSQKTISQKLDWSSVKPRTNSRLDLNLTLPRKPLVRRSLTPAATQRPTAGSHAASGSDVCSSGAAVKSRRLARPGALSPGSKRRGSVRGVHAAPNSPIHKTRRRDWGSGVQMTDGTQQRPASRRPTQTGSLAAQGARNAQHPLPPRARTKSNSVQVGHTSARAQAALDQLTASGSGDDGPLADLLEQVGDLLSDLNATQRELDSRY